MKEYLYISKRVKENFGDSPEFLREVYRASRRRYYYYSKNKIKNGRLYFRNAGYVVWRPVMDKDYPRTMYYDGVSDPVFVFAVDEKLPQNPYDIEIGGFWEVVTKEGKWRLL